MEAFSRYEENFINSTRIVSRGMRSLEGAGGNVDAVISASVDVEGELSEAEGYVKAMEVELRNLSSQDKRSCQPKADDYKEEIELMKARFQTAKFNAESTALKSNNGARSKLIAANQKLDQSTASLEQSRQILARTEDIGGTIITDLEGQKEILLAAKDKVDETRVFTLNAKNVLRIMGNRAFMHKVCVLFTIFMLTVVIGVIIYFGFIKQKK